VPRFLSSTVILVFSGLLLAAIAIVHFLSLSFNSGVSSVTLAAKGSKKETSKQKPGKKQLSKDEILRRKIARRKALEKKSTLPETVVRFEWLRNERQKPNEPSGRRKYRHTKVFRNNFDSLRLMIDDLMETWGGKYPKGASFLTRLATLEKAVLETNGPLAPLAAEFDELLKESMLANPLIDFDSLLFIDSSRAMRPRNWLSIGSVGKTSPDNSVRKLSPVSPDGKVTTVFTPPNKGSVIAMDLHFDADKLMYSSGGKNRQWQLHEVAMPPKLDKETGGPIVREITTIPDKDVGNYDSCYGPDGSIFFTSTATQLGVPCIRGGSPIANIYKRHPDGKIERLTIEQDHNWSPVMMPDGRVMYQRWEYTDTPHAFYRLVFSMNPDGTGQAAVYGTNSYWPNASFYAIPVPGSSTKFVATVTGHHDQNHIGHLVLFDTAKGYREAQGAVQRIPGYRQEVPAPIRDAISGFHLPIYLQSYPLSDKYFLASCIAQPGGPSEMYMVDIFDNGLKLYGMEGRYMTEPIPFRKTKRPPIIADRTDPTSETATVVMTNVYMGDGLKGVPRGKVKKLRLYSYNFAMRRMGGQVDRVGLDGPWDVRVIIGEVPVEADGSANFTVPAMMPIAVQPLDEEGKALQYMRSWFTCRPGEVLSCIGCHEDANTVVPYQQPIAVKRAPSPVTPWYGPIRGFSFNREVQPALDEYCVGCHNGDTDKKGRDGEKIVDLTLRPDIRMSDEKGKLINNAHFPPAYYELKRHVRNATMESDLHMLTPYDLHADQTRLVQLLKKGHYGVKLDKEAWSRLITWIDFNTPAHGSWKEITDTRIVVPVSGRRQKLMKRYANVDFDPEMAVTAAMVEETMEGTGVKPSMPKAPKRPASIRSKYPLTVDAESLKAATDSKTGKLKELIVPLSRKPEMKLVSVSRREGKRKPRNRPPKEIAMKFVRIPAGSYVFGDATGYADEWNERQVTIDRPFWMGVCEVTNEEYALFDASHDSRLEHTEFLHFNGGRERGSELNTPKQPVLRISQLEAKAFCRWLSLETGRRCSLPTEEQWEWAARFGKSDENGFKGKDFSTLANLADVQFSKVRGPMPRWRFTVPRIDDGAKVSTRVGRYKPNEAGLYDMIGNVAEWTSSRWRADDKQDRHVVARGGSWQDVPYRARPASRTPYRPEMKVIDVGFRVIVEE